MMEKGLKKFLSGITEILFQVLKLNDLCAFAFSL